MLGFDHVIAILCNTPSIGDAIAFPKTAKGHVPDDRLTQHRRAQTTPRPAHRVEGEAADARAEGVIDKERDYVRSTSRSMGCRVDYGLLGCCEDICCFSQASKFPSSEIAVSVLPSARP